MEDLKQDVIDTLKKNSNVLNEETETYDISGSEDFLGSLIDTKYNDSLAYQICDVQPMKSSFGKIFMTRRKDNSTDMEVISKPVDIKPFNVQTGFTQEVIQDMGAMFGKSAKRSVQQVLKGLSAEDENKSIITKLYTDSTTKPEVTVADSNSLESVMLQISKKVAESVIEMNRETYKTLDSFCVLPKEFASAFLGSFNYMTEGKEKSLFVGRMGKTDYYINPFPNTASQFTDDFDYSYEIEDTSIPNYAYVGLHSAAAGVSSLVFAPYIYESQYVTDPDTGNFVLNLRNRYGLITSPLHEPLKNRSMLHKFALIKG